MADPPRDREAGYTLAMLFMPQTPSAEAAFADLRAALASGERSRIEALFADRADAAHLFAAASRDVPLPKWRVNVFPAPPGWGRPGDLWATFHTRQPIEQDHDPVYPLVRTAAGPRLGREIPETAGGENPIRSASIDAHLVPEANRADVTVDLKLSGTGPRRADVLRLQDLYAVASATIDGAPRTVVVAPDDAIPQAKLGDILRVGSLLIPWTPRHAHELGLAYSGILRKGDGKGLDEDRVDARTATLTAWWTPSAGRLPFRTETRITGPKDWILRSEGVPVDASFPPIYPANGEEQRVAYRCDVPISFPKVIGGRYVLAASLTDGGRTFRAYHLDASDPARGEADVRSAAAAVRFFEARLGPFPFAGYDVLDGDGYYGIESYSYTLLDKRITSWATTHEIGHTYFGGLVPCPYVRDSWNEGLTQYLDSVLFKNDSDKTLERALRQTSLHRPLTELPIPYDDADTTYYRGAFVMAMLAHEIGQSAVDAGMRALVEDRRGRDTGWLDLRPYFERAAGRSLGWFWDQWVSGTEWPRLDLAEAETTPDGTRYRTRVDVRQSGTKGPYRLRFQVRLSGEGKTHDEEVTLDAATRSVDVATDFRPSETSLTILGYVFGTAGPAIAVKAPASRLQEPSRNVPGKDTGARTRAVRLGR